MVLRAADELAIAMGVQTDKQTGTRATRLAGGTERCSPRSRALVPRELTNGTPLGSADRQVFQVEWGRASAAEGGGRVALPGAPRVEVVLACYARRGDGADASQTRAGGGRLVRPVGSPMSDRR